MKRVALLCCGGCLAFLGGCGDVVLATLIQTGVPVIVQWLQGLAA